MRKLLLAFAAGLIVLAPGIGSASTLYGDLGDHAGLARIVDAATSVWLKDPRVGPTFDNTNIDRFKRLLVDQLCQLTGGGCSYGGRDMYKAHKGLRLDSAQFNALAEDLQIAMAQLDIPFTTQSRLVALLAPMHRDIVTK